MRVTNQMMTNSSLINVNNNKTLLSKLEDQYTTGKKIQKPSDDPIVAVRALKLRTTVSEISQYLEKNIPDAQNWLDVTEGALSAVSDVMGKINALCVQGENDTLSSEDRDSIVENLKQYRDEIYKQGNTDYAGRYVFTGFKTNTSLIYTEPAKDKEYTITENFVASDVQVTSQITGTNAIPNTVPASPYTINTPQLTQNYRIQLAYDKLETSVPAINKADGSSLGITISPKISSDPDAYIVPTGAPAAPIAHYISDTGEVILNEEAYNLIKTTGDIKAVYKKINFDEGDVRPEHYFDCISEDVVTKKVIEYKSEDQEIKYEINYNQKLTVNTQAKDAIKTDIGRLIDDVIDAVDAVKFTEDKIAEVAKRLNDTTLSDGEKQYYNELNEQLKTELVLKNEKVKNVFTSGIAVSKQQLNIVNVENSDLGSRYVRMQLVESRLETQSVQVEELMSNNEDVDLAEIIIRFSSAQALYNASLSATAKTVSNTLLDFL